MRGIDSISQYTFIGALKSRCICVCTADIALRNSLFQPVMQSSLKVFRNSTDFAQKNSNTVCRVLNSSLSMYRRPFSISAPCGLPYVVRLCTASSCKGGAAYGIANTSLRRAEGVKVESGGSGAASTEGGGFELKILRMGFPEDPQFSHLSTAPVPERTLTPSDLSGLSGVDLVFFCSEVATDGG